MESRYIGRRRRMRVRSVVLAVVLVIPLMGFFNTQYATNGEYPYAQDDVVGQNDIMGIDGTYHSFDEIELELQGIASGYPGITKLMSIGKTYEGRDIWAIKISDNPDIEEDEPEVYFNGGHHAREWMAFEVPLCLINALVENYTTNATIRDIVDSRQIWIVPAVNPDGRVYDGDNDPATYVNWRKNRRDNGDGTFGVDLNRNYGYLWGAAGASDMTSEEGYRGPYPFSENETSAIRDFVEQHDFVFSISYHSSGQLILYPWGFTKGPSKDDELFASLGAEMSKRITNTADSNRDYYRPIRGSDLYMTSGSDEDWLYAENGVYSFVIELYPHWSDFFPIPDPAVSSPYNGFHPSADKIIPVCNDNIPAALFLAQIADNPFQVMGHVTLSADPVEQRINQSETKSFSIGLLNDGNASDTFNLTHTIIPGWTIDLSQDSVMLDRNASTNITLSVTPAPNAEGTYPIHVNAVSENGTGATGSLELKVSVPYFNDSGVISLTPFSWDEEYMTGNYSIASTVKNFGRNANSFNTSLEIFKLGAPQSRILASEDSEDVVTDWTVEDMDGPYSPTVWHMSARASHTGTKSLWAGVPGGNSYSDETVQFLLSPSFSLKEAVSANLTFYHKYNMEANYDFGTIDIFNGNSWVMITSFTGGLPTFTEFDFDMKDYIGLEDVRVRFRFTSDGGTVREGWFLDDIRINAEFPSESRIYGPVNNTSSLLPQDSEEIIGWHFDFDTNGTYKMVSRTWLEGDSDSTNDVMFVRFKINDTKYGIVLRKGANLISIPMVLSDTSVASVFSSIAGKYNIVWYYEPLDQDDPWKNFNPSNPLNDFFDVNRTMGLWVHVTDDVFLNLDIAIPANTAIDLESGWNLIGYPSMTERTVSDVLGSISYERIEGFDPFGLQRTRILTGNDWMRPGWGYWVKVNSPQVLNVIP
jgi:carboxypeptidase T